MSNNKERVEPAVIAHQCYEKNEFKAALKHLDKLEAAVGPTNKKVQHNKALVEFMQSNMTEIEKFTSIVSELTEVTFPEIEEIDYSNPFHIYNYAVLLYHSRHYYQCKVLLEALLGSIKTVKDKRLLQHVILLYMESALCRIMAERVLEVAKSHGNIVSSNETLNPIFERLISRANIMLGQKIRTTIKPDAIENLFIIAQEQYKNNQAKEAVSTLAQYKILNHNYDYKHQGEDIWAALNNNLGVIYLSLGKPFLATKYFQHALKEHFRAVDLEEEERLIMCRDRPLYVYNLGLALMAANKIEGAFECLVEAARHYPNNSRIWLRLAECCVKKCSQDEQISVKKLSSGVHTHLSLTRENQPPFSSSNESFAIPTLSLEFAALCLRNSLTLLLNYTQPADLNSNIIHVPPSLPINWKQRCYLMNSVYVLQAYVFLKLHDPLAALSVANELLNQPEIARSHRALAHIYAAEALINMDRLTEVTEHLDTKLIHDLTTTLPSSLRDMISVSMWAKVAVSHILKGDLVTAKNILVKVNSPRLLPLQVYFEMYTGNIEDCLATLRKLRLSNFN